MILFHGTVYLLVVLDTPHTMHTHHFVSDQGKTFKLIDHVFVCDKVLQKVTILFLSKRVRVQNFFHVMTISHKMFNINERIREAVVPDGSFYSSTSNDASNSFQ